MLCVQVLNTSSPAVQYYCVVCDDPKLMALLVRPTFFPRHLVDKEVTQPFGLHTVARAALALLSKSQRAIGEST